MTQSIKAHLSGTAVRETTKIVFTIVLFAAGSALLLGSHAGVVSLDQLAKFWPLTLVATGLVELLADRKA